MLKPQNTVRLIPLFMFPITKFPAGVKNKSLTLYVFQRQKRVNMASRRRPIMKLLNTGSESCLENGSYLCELEHRSELEFRNYFLEKSWAREGNHLLASIPVDVVMNYR